jgi:hypothetical protein
MRLGDAELPALTRFRAAGQLVWLNRCQAGDRIDIGCLTIREGRVLHMPGELFVEYQLAAQEMRPDLFVCMAAYGDFAPGYIGTEIAYSEGGYETSRGVSLVAPQVEAALMTALRTLLAAPGRGPEKLGVDAHEREVQAARQRERANR